MTKAAFPTIEAMNPEANAQQVLATVWAPDTAPDAIPLPVNPFVIADRLGIKMFTANLSEGVSGVLIKRAGQDAEIHVQTSDSPSRQRFTCAHELGHYVKRSATDDDAWEYVEHRNLITSQGTDTEEIYANRFAASLLMPEIAVRKLYDKLKAEAGTPPPPAALAFEFGVSADAMQYRLANLGLQ